MSSDSVDEAPTSTLPAELQFLASAECSPDSSDRNVQRIGNMRGTIHRAGTNGKLMRTVSEAVRHWDETLPLGDGHCYLQRCRRSVKSVLTSSIVQGFVFLLTLCDLIVVFFRSIVKSRFMHERIIFDIFGSVVVFVIGVEVFARLFVRGTKFLQSPLCVFELVVVVVISVDVVLLSNLDLRLTFFRILRPCVRLAQVLYLLYRVGAYRAILREHVSKNRVRFIKDGFDLDLAYITDQIIASSHLATRLDMLYYNSVYDAARFLNERHFNKYLVLNLMQEVHYPTAHFFHRVAHFPIRRKSVPALQALMDLCRILHDFLSADDDFTLFVHSKHGKGRVAMIVIALLLYRGEASEVSGALILFEHKRSYTDADDFSHPESLDNASQRRFLEYFCKMINQRRVDSCLRSAKLQRVMVQGLRAKRDIDVVGFTQETEQLTTGMDISKCRGNSPAVNNDVNEIDRGTRLIGNWDVKEGSLKVKEGSLSGELDDQEEEEIFSSDPASGKNQNVYSNSIENGRSVIREWHFVDTELDGGFRIEVRRRKVGFGERFIVEGSRSDDSLGMQEVLKRMRFSCRRWFKKCRRLLTKSRFCRRSQKPDISLEGEDDIVFSFWLHTAYLELEEPKLSVHTRAHGEDDSVVTVVLERLCLDRPHNGSSPHNLSSAVKVVLTFNVDYRRNFKQEAHQSSKTSFVSEAEVSKDFSLAWLTWSVERLWPYAETAVRNLFQESVEPQLRETLPSIFKDLAFTHIVLGDGLPQFGPLVAHSRVHDGYELQFDIMVHYKSFTDIVIDTGFACLGIRELTLNGMLSVKLKPILAELPIVAGVQLFFINPPEIDLAFSGILEVANISVVHRAIVQAINNVMLGALVLPNVFSVDYTPKRLEAGEEISRMTDVLPMGVLWLAIVEAKGLYGADLWITGVRSSDPFAVVTLGQQTSQTQTIKGTCNPTWNHEMNFLVYNEDQHIGISVYDADLFGKDFLGRIVQLPINKVTCQGEEGFTGMLADTPNTVESTIYVRGRMHHLHEGIDDLLDVTRVPLRRGDIVAVLVCELFGGRVIPELAQPTSLVFKVRVGKVADSQPCHEFDVHDMHGELMTVQVERIIERLAKERWSINRIAEVVGEEPAVVRSVVRRRLGWNVRVRRRINLLLTAADLDGFRGFVELTLERKGGNPIASGTVPFGEVVRQAVTAGASEHKTGKLRTQVDCVPESIGVELDIELRLLSTRRTKATFSL